MEIQRLLGSDIVMAFDECPALPATAEAVAASMELSMRWAQRSRDAFGGPAAGTRCSASSRAALDERPARGVAPRR